MARSNITLWVIFLATMVSLSSAESSTPSLWQNTAFLAIYASMLALALIYMVSYVLDSHELKFLVKEELLQLLVTLIFVAGFVGFVDTFNSLRINADADMVSAESTMNSIVNQLGTMGVAIGKEGGRSVTCSFQVVNFGVAPCSGYNALSPAVTTSIQISTVALAEINSMIVLNNLSENFIFTFFFPLGLFLRTFKYTRGAGSMFIAIAISFYLVLPTVFYILHQVSLSVLASATTYGLGSIYTNVPVSPAPVISECDPYGFKGHDNEEKAVLIFKTLVPFMNSGSASFLDTMIYHALISVTIPTIISLAATVVSIRAIASIAGSEVDVQGLSRLI